MAGIIKGEKGDKTKPTAWRDATKPGTKRREKTKEKKAEAETEETNHAVSREEERDRDEALQRSMKGASIIQQLWIMGQRAEAAVQIRGRERRRPAALVPVGDPVGGV